MLCSDNDENGDDDEEMDLDASKRDDEIVQALAAADALGKGSNGTNPETDSVIDGLKELDMDNYDDEDDGISIPSAFFTICSVYHLYFLCRVLVN